MSGYFAVDPRPLVPDDPQATRVLLMGALGVTPYIDRALEVLERAERGNDPEHRALVIARDGTVAGLVLFGTIAGTDGGARLHGIALAPGVEADDVGERLLDAAAARMQAAGCRYLLAEVADDAALGAVLALLSEHGFIEEARIADFVREGIALIFLELGL